MNGRAHERLGVVAARTIALAVGMLAVYAAAPAHAHAADLFPVDDWVGEGLDEAKDVAFGGLEIGAEAIAELLVNTLAALVELLIPDAFVDAGVGAIKWLCTVPTFAGGGGGGGQEVLQLPHVNQLRGVLTWFGVTLLPLGLVYAGGRSVLSPSAYGDSPQDVVMRVVISAAWLALYVWAWESIARLSTYMSSGVLSLSFVPEGLEDLMGALGLAGGAVGPVSEFAVLILLLVCAIALIALLIFKVALVVITAFLFVVGGLVGALYPFPFGRKLVNGYLVAVAAVVSLPVIWAVIFALGAALMVDVSASGTKGFAGFIQQFWVLGAALAVFALSIKIAFSAVGMATSTISGFASGALAGGEGGPSPTSTAKNAHRAATAHGMRNASSQRRAAMSGRGGAAGTGGGVQRTQDAAEGLRGAVASGGTVRTAASAGTALATGGGSAAAGAAAKAGGSAPASQRAAAGAASQGSSSAAAQRAATVPPTRPTGADPGAESVRSTASAQDGPSIPVAAPVPHESARSTSAPKGSRASADPLGSSQRPPRTPPSSRGGKP